MKLNCESDKYSSAYTTYFTINFFQKVGSIKLYLILYHLIKSACSSKKSSAYYKYRVKWNICLLY